MRGTGSVRSRRTTSRTGPSDPRLAGYAGLALLVAGAGVLVDVTDGVDPLVAAGALMIAGGALLGVDLVAGWREIRRR